MIVILAETLLLIQYKLKNFEILSCHKMRHEFFFFKIIDLNAYI